VSISSHTILPRTEWGNPSKRAMFVTTQWSAVLAAGRSDTTHARSALEQLCRHYSISSLNWL
jgi:hypothetical protein